MRSRDPLRCVQATVAAGTARFRLWTDPASGEDEGSLDFGRRSAAYRSTRPAGPALVTVSTPRATYVREAGDRGWMRVHSARRRQGSWDPFGILDVVAALDALEPCEPEPTQRGALQHHAGLLGPEALARLAGEDAGVARRVLPATGGGPLQLAVWLDSRRRLRRLRYRAGAGPGALLHLDLFDFARPLAVAPPSHAQPVDLDRVRAALREVG